MRNLDKSTALDEDLQDLKLRFELLEGDRKAYYETSQWAIRRNKEDINKMRSENKRLSDAIARIKKSEVESRGSRLTMSDLEKFDQKICETQKKYDELRSEYRQKQLKLKQQLDHLNNIKRESDLINSNQKDSSEAKEIRMLENRLDKAVIKYNEAQSIRKTYELIVKRLEEERLTFDNQLSSFEKTLKVKKSECQELENMSRDANHAKDVAKTELARFEQQINDERKEREKDLQSRKELLKQRLEANDKADRKILKQDEINIDSKNGGEANEKLDEQMEKKLIEYQETMRTIKEATGVADISEVIAKFQSQKETKTHLTSLQETNTLKIQDLKELKEKLFVENEDFKFQGHSKLAHSSRLIKEFEQELLKADKSLVEAKLKYKRSLKVMKNAIAGVQHLYEKLDAVKTGDQGKIVLVNEKNIVNSMHVCVKKLETLALNLHEKEIPETPPKDITQQQPGEIVNILIVNPGVLPAHNTRIKMKPLEFADAEVDDENEEGEFEVPDRESIKKHTLQLINARQKIKQPKKVKKRKPGLDDDE